MFVYDAIKEMRRLTEIGESFSFSFMSLNTSKGSSHGVVSVSKARLRPSEKSNKNEHAEFMLSYVETDTGKAKHFYYPLLMEFNGVKCELQ